MKRGEIWTGAGTGYASKPRPVLILQDDDFPTASVTVIPFTTDPEPAPLIRLAVAPDTTTGLSAPSSLMVDKITTTQREKIRQRIGRLDDRQMAQVNALVAAFLGLGRGVRSSAEGDNPMAAG